MIVRPLVLGPGRRGPETLVGGKAAGLQRLVALGLPVPRWITFTTHAADAVLNPRGSALAGALAEEPDREEIRRLVRTAPWPESLRVGLERALRKLRAGRLAVRSSAVGEDGALASHAGQFATLLDVDRADLVEAVQACWCSAFTPEVAAYRRRRGIRPTWPRIAVVVQEMVDSAAAGVAFTADPRTGAPAHVVAAGYGLGSGIVSDGVEADVFTRARGSDRWDRRVAHKTVAVSAVSGTARPTTVPVPERLRDRPALSEETLDRLAALLTRLDPRGDVPVDVEWAVDGAGEVALLQVRPLTALPRGALAVWDDSNIGENFPGLTLPLTASYVRHLYTRLFGRALAEVGLPQPEIAALEAPLRGLLGLIRGRLYLNLTNYYRLFAAVPGCGWTVRSWEAALGIEGGDGLRSVAGSRGRVSLLAVARTVRRLVARFRGLDDEIRRFRGRNEAFLARWERVGFEARSADELIRILRDLNGELVDLWTVHIFNDLFLFVLNGALERLIGDVELHRQVIGGVRDAGTIEPLVSLFALADAARAVPEVDAVLEGSLPEEAAWARMVQLPAAAEFRRRAQAHLSRFGDRTGEELKLETPVLGDRPWLLVSLLRGCRGVAPPRHAVARQAATRAHAEDALRARLARRPWARLGWVLVERVRRGVEAREYMSFARARCFGILRRLYRAAGAAFVAEGELPRVDDIFHLTVGELDAFVTRPATRARLRSAAAHRREAYGRFGAEQLPHRLICRGSVHSYDWSQANPAIAPDGERLRGIPSSAGVARGRARVVDVPSPHVRADGEILVAPATEPAWMFLMYAARGVVVERGSVLSHAAIIGRELGIPTVVGVAGATVRIRTGDIVEVNGITGDVRILARGAVLSRHSPVWQYAPGKPAA